MLNQHKILRVLQLISLLQQTPPKSVQHLASILDTTHRTAYRYLDLLRELGFDLQRDHNNKYFIIHNDEIAPVHFNPDETEFLRQLILTSGKDSQLKDAVLKKIYLSSETTIIGNHLLKAHLGKIVEDLCEAIICKLQVKLKNYHSLNGETISDRIVEPLAFTDNYSSLIAYEIGSKKNKYFNIQRISNVEILDKSWDHTDKHQIELPDAFGFAPGTETFAIHLELSMKAFILLKEEYPLSSPHLKPIPKSNKYELKMEVNSLKPIERFIKGLKDEVEIISM
jgi:predicted DNA-binding transcriptional regulator YafY